MEIARSKILSFIIVPFLLLAISGAGVHFHFCKSQNKLYTHLHIDGGSLHESSCCADSDICTDCCGNSEAGGYGYNSDISDCCTDVYESFETDDRYKFQSFFHKLFPAVKKIQYYPADYKLSNSSFITVCVDFKPPDILSTVILLL